MTDVTNAGTACGEGVIGASLYDEFAAHMREAAARMSVIKPLWHWRSVGEVAEKVVGGLKPFPARALRDGPWDISALVE